MLKLLELLDAIMFEFIYRMPKFTVGGLELYSLCESRHISPIDLPLVPYSISMEIGCFSLGFF